MSLNILTILIESTVLSIFATTPLLTPLETDFPVPSMSNLPYWSFLPTKTDILVVPISSPTNIFSFVILELDVIFKYNPNLTDEYYNSSLFGIFHGAYVKEPFGYSILQAVDAGKLPIISKGWCPEFNYPYRASSKEEFENMVKLIQNTNKETRKNIFNSAKEFLKKFDNKDHWVERMKTIYNE